mmetsp:Transcript_31031/g.90177  ORF Transcript_31031/g.90177 Transcript_31031/m.90177 type:complete len:109 (+) Transcript_31031:1429-1755(+)
MATLNRRQQTFPTGHSAWCPVDKQRVLGLDGGFPFPPRPPSSEEQASYFGPPKARGGAGRQDGGEERKRGTRQTQKQVGTGECPHLNHHDSDTGHTSMTQHAAHCRRC